MAKKPTYAEVMQLVDELKKELAKLRRSEAELQNSEAKYRALAEGTNDIVYCLDTNGILTYVGPQVEHYGMHREDIVGRHFLDFVSGQDKGALNKDFQRTISTGAEFPTEFRISDNTGRFFWFEDFGKVHRDPSGNIIQVTGVLRDVTDRKRAEEALQNSEARLREMCRLSPFPIAIIESDGRYTYVNKKFTEIFGYSLADIPTGKDWFSKAFPEQAYRETAMFAWQLDQKVAGSDGQVPKEFKVTCKDGTIRDIVFRPVFLDAGTQLIAFEDLTEIRRAAREREEMLQQLKKGHDDLLSILNMLQLGIATVDQDDRLTFVNVTAQNLIGMDKEAILKKHWEEIFHLDDHDKTRLKAMWRRPAKKRSTLQVQVAFLSKRRYWMDMDVQDDPRDRQRKILLFYDLSEIFDLRRMLKGEARFHDLVGNSKAMQVVYQQIQDVSQVDWTVLIEGETGTGKELVARAIHYSGHRKQGPFIAVNCAGLDDQLLTSQLFGHKRGAFTGAVGDHKGFFEVAHGGTLLLDEIGDISENVQTSLLRVLEDKEILRLGESNPRKVDVRVLASTHRDLSEKVEKGSFRSDLLYRIRVARIALPPLRQRREDIPLLVEAFLGQSRAATGRPVTGMKDDVMPILLEYPWPGNVRELKSAIDFATLHAKGEAIHAEDLPPEIIDPTQRMFSEEPLHLDERQRLLAALARAKGNRSVAARDLGIARSTLYRRLEKFGM